MVLNHRFKEIVSGWQLMSGGEPSESDWTALRRHQLHAWKLDLAHPVEPRRLALSAPLAEDMHDLLLGCGWSAETLSARFGAAEALTD